MFSKVRSGFLGLRYLGIPLPDSHERWLSKMLLYLHINFSNSKKFPSFAKFPPPIPAYSLCPLMARFWVAQNMFSFFGWRQDQSPFNSRITRRDWISLNAFIRKDLGHHKKECLQSHESSEPLHEVDPPTPWPWMLANGVRRSAKIPRKWITITT